MNTLGITVSEEFPFKLSCYLCGRVIAAGSAPFSEDVKQFLKDTPCSLCVCPMVFIKDYL